MKIFYVISLIAVMLIGVRTTYTDTRWHKVYNKDIAIFLAGGVAFQVAYFIANGPADFLMFILNLGVSFAVAYIFFVFHIWAAGDAKLFSLVAFFVPYRLFGVTGFQIFPAFYLLGIIFAVGLIYVIIESIVLFIKEILEHKVQATPWKTFVNVDGIISWLMGYSIVILLDCVLLKVSPTYGNGNRYILVLINILAITVTLNMFTARRQRIIVLFIAISIRIILMIIAGKIENLLSVQTIVLVLALMLMQKFTSRYNYRSIPTEKLQEGQILSRASLASMLPSRVQGLPDFTDETTRSRLTYEQVCAIQRWKKSKYGSPEIIIVRHIPFAPFIFAGTIIFYIFQLTIGEL